MVRCYDGHCRLHPLRLLVSSLTSRTCTALLSGLGRSMFTVSFETVPSSLFQSLGFLPSDLCYTRELRDPNVEAIQLPLEFLISF